MTTHDPTPATRLPRRLTGRLTVTALISLATALVVALIIVAIKGSWGPLQRADASVATHLHATAVAHPSWVRTMLVVSDVGSPAVMRVAVGILVVVLWLRGARRLALWAAVTMAGGALLDVVMKSAVGRARPRFPDPVATASGAAFPSGHALAATLGAGVLLLWVLPLTRSAWRVAARAVGVFVPLAVGFSRIALGVHWLSDVIGGWLLGIGFLAATTAAFDVPKSER